MMRPTTLSAAALMLVIAAPAEACYCSPTVYDPTNHDTALETLAKGTSILGEAAKQVNLLTETVETLGPAGLLDLSGFAGLGALTSGLSTVTSAVGEIQSTVSGVTGAAGQVTSLADRLSDLDLDLVLGSAVGQSGLLSEAVPSFASLSLPSGVSAGDIATLSGAQGFVTAVLRGGSVSSASEGAELEERRRAEYQSAIDEGHAAALFNLEAVASTSERVENLAKLAEEYQNAGNLRSQMAVQMLALNQAMIALIEETAAVRALLAADLRVRTGAVFASTRGVGQTDASKTTIPEEWK